MKSGCKTTSALRSYYARIFMEWRQSAIGRGAYHGEIDRILDQVSTANLFLSKDRRLEWLAEGMRRSLPGHVSHHLKGVATKHRVYESFRREAMGTAGSGSLMTRILLRDGTAHVSHVHFIPVDASVKIEPLLPGAWRSAHGNHPDGSLDLFPAQP